MNIKKLLIGFVITFAVVLVGNIIVVYLWNLIMHGQGAFHWGLSFISAVVAGIVVSVTMAMLSKEK